MSENLLSALGMLFVTALILFLAYLTSRWIGIHGAPNAGKKLFLPTKGSTSHFNVIDRLALGRGEMLVLLQIGADSCLLVGVTEHEIRILKEWSGAEYEALFGISEEIGREEQPQGFVDILSKRVTDIANIGGRGRRNASRERRGRNDRINRLDRVENFESTERRADFGSDADI